MDAELSRPSIIDPCVVPSEAAHDHLPAIDPQSLSVDQWRELFRSPRSWTPELCGDRSNGGEGLLRDAAVLLALTQRGGVLLTLRTPGLRHHAGQVAFPGGRVEDDDGNPSAAALREAQEEIGLNPDQVEILGQLPEYHTGSGFRICPVVGLLLGPLDLQAQLRPDPNEVAVVFEAPLPFVFDPGNHRRHRVMGAGGPRIFYSMLWHCADPRRQLALDRLPRDVAAIPEPRSFQIWGATAAILRNFYHFLHAHRALLEPTR